MDCSHFSLNPGGTTRCNILYQIGIIELAPPNSPNFPCTKCKEGWGDIEPTLENPSPYLKEQMGDQLKIVGGASTHDVVPASLDVITRRLEICGGCDLGVGGKCLACGCGINAKVKDLAAKCPIGKW